MITWKEAIYHKFVAILYCGNHVLLYFLERQQWIELKYINNKHLNILSDAADKTVVSPPNNFKLDALVMILRFENTKNGLFESVLIDRFLN